MIDVRVLDGRYCPCLVCDECQEVIEGEGNVMYLVNADGVKSSELYATHKHCCHQFEHGSHPAPDGPATLAV